MDEFVTVCVSKLVEFGVAHLIIQFDSRRLAQRGVLPRWNSATYWAAVSGLFFPSVLAVGAHVWVSRDGFFCGVRFEQSLRFSLPHSYGFA